MLSKRKIKDKSSLWWWLDGPKWRMNNQTPVGPRKIRKDDEPETKVLEGKEEQNDKHKRTFGHDRIFAASLSVPQRCGRPTASSFTPHRATTARNLWEGDGGVIFCDL